MLMNLFQPNKSTAENYNIDDLSSGDETDDDERPNKPVPAWAQRQQLLLTTKMQYRQHHDFSQLFDGCQAYQVSTVIFVLWVKASIPILFSGTIG